MPVRTIAKLVILLISLVPAVALLLTAPKLVALLSPALIIIGYRLLAH